MSSLLSATIAVSIVIASSLIVLNAISPTLEEGKMLQSFNNAKQVMGTIDTTMNELIFEATGSKRSIDLTIDQGELIVSGKEDSIKLRLKDMELIEPGTRVEEGRIVISSGPAINAYEADVDNDGNTDLVLENDAVLFAVKKYGSPSSPEFINTSGMISLMRNKDLGVDIVPKSGIFIDEKTNSSYGYGYTELTQEGRDLPSSGIRLLMNSEANITYEALFTLGAGNDFVELEIKHIS